jgi:hypothetical protein
LQDALRRCAVQEHDQLKIDRGKILKMNNSVKTLPAALLIEEPLFDLINNDSLILFLKMIFNND